MDTAWPGCVGQRTPLVGFQQSALRLSSGVRDIRAGETGHHHTCLRSERDFIPFKSTMDVYARARESIDAAHSADPQRTPDGRPAELVYAERMEAWINRLVPDAPPVLQLAARCQHLERWSIPRASYPEGKVGYLAWRKSLYHRQAGRARELLLAAGFSAGETADAADWVAKAGLKTNPGTQALEDAACLVFLENEIGSFAAQHAAYPREKFVDILRKTWKKMSPRAQALGLGLPLPPATAALVRDAVNGP